MISTLNEPILIYCAWILALLSITLGLYLLVVNWKSVSNRLISLLLATVAINQAAQGFLIGADDASQAYLPALLIAITMPMLLPLMMIVTIHVLKPDWIQERQKRVIVIQWTVIALAGLPGILALVDTLIGTRAGGSTALYYTVLNPDSYLGGFIPLAKFTAGILARFIKTLNIIVLSLFLLAFCFYVAILDKEAKPSRKALGWILFIVVGISGAFQVVVLFFNPNSLICVLICCGICICWLSPHGF